MNHSYFVYALKCVPSHEEEWAAPEDLAARLAQDLELGQDAAQAICATVLSILTVFDLLGHQGHKVRIKTQIANYFRLSLLWYVENSDTLTTNWERSGTAKEPNISNLLDQAPYLLKILEERRVKLCTARGLTASPTRIQPCSVILIKAHIDGVPHFLHQWDQKAERFQLIGGKRRATETEEETAHREFLEEIGQDFVLGRDVEIRRCLNHNLTMLEISRTYGALTLYELSLYQAVIHKMDLKLSEGDRWISVREMLALKTDRGVELPRLGRLVSAVDEDFFDKLPDSVPPMRRKSVAGYIDLKPNFYGLGFRFGEYWADKRKRKRS